MTYHDTLLGSDIARAHFNDSMQAQYSDSALSILDTAVTLSHKEWLDSELVETQLRALGYSFTPALDDADVVLYNTCSVRERSEQKVWSRLGLLKERKTAEPSLVIGVIGCMAERDGVGLMKRMPQVDLMCGPSELDQLPFLLDNVLNVIRCGTGLRKTAPRRRPQAG